MGLLLKLFLIAALVAVLHSAPLDEHSESTTVGIKTLPATLSKKDDSKESDEDKGDVKRVSRNVPFPSPTEDKNSDSLSQTQTQSRPARDTTHFISGVPSPQSKPAPQTYQQNSQSSTTRPQFGSRPARDTTHFISGVPSPQSNPTPQTYQQNPQLGSQQPQGSYQQGSSYPQGRQVRAAEDSGHGSQHTPTPGHPQTKPAPGSRPARDTTHFISGVPTPQSSPAPQTYQHNPQLGSQQPQGGNSYPQGRQVRAAEDSGHGSQHTPTPGHPQTKPAPGSRPARDTNHPANQGKVQTRPAPQPAKTNEHKVGTQQNGPTNRRVRDTESSSSSTTETSQQ